MRSNIDELRSRLAPIFARFPAVAAVFLFGSAARGMTRPGSDIDLAVVPVSSISGTERLDMLGALTEAGFDRVDLVVLDGRDLVMQFEAVRTNCLIYARDDFSRGGYFSRTLREYFDLEPYLAVQRDAARRRLVSGQS